MIKLTVEGSPVALKRHRHLKNGHTYDPSKADKRLFLANVIDNYVKLVLDALNGVFYKDDSQICHLKTIKKYSEQPRTVVVIKGIE